MAIGTDTGTVEIYDTDHWQVIKVVTLEGSIRQIAFDPANRDMLIAVEAGRSQFGYVHLIGLQGQRTHRWQRVTASARNVTYAPDGETMAFVCADGGLWFYSFRHDRWRYANDHRVDTLTALFSSDGKLFASSDRQGSLIVRELPD